MRATLAAIVTVMAVGLATACSVPDLSLDGKACPCAEGYVCDTNVNLCVHMLVGDGGGPDVPLQPTCLGSQPGSVLLTNSFDSGLSMTPVLGTWVASGGEAVQSSATLDLAYAYATLASSASRYRIVAKMHGAAGGTGLGIAFRGDLGSKKQYSCVWRPAAKQLVLQTTNGGGNSMPLATKPLTSGAATDTVTMELDANGSTFTCCLRELAGASVVGSDAVYPTGRPGLVTNLMHGNFDDFVVYTQ